MVDCLELLFTVYCWRIVYCSFKCVERMNDAISWRETRLIELLMTKLYCFRDGHYFRLRVNSLLAVIMVERNTSAETITSSVIPGLASAWFVVNDDRDPKGSKWCAIIIYQVSPRHAGFQPLFDGIGEHL